MTTAYDICAAVDSVRWNQLLCIPAHPPNKQIFAKDWRSNSWRVAYVITTTTPTDVSYVFIYVRNLTRERHVPTSINLSSESGFREAKPWHIHTSCMTEQSRTKYVTGHGFKDFGTGRQSCPLTAGGYAQQMS